MIRLVAFLPAWWFMQIGNGSIQKPNPIAEYGIGIGMALLIAALWREDRKSRIEYQASADVRYESVVSQLKDIIHGNTTAMTTLADKLAGKVNNCPVMSDPLIGNWMRVWAEHSMENLEKKQKRHIQAED